MGRFTNCFVIAVLAMALYSPVALASEDPPEGTTVLMTASCVGEDVVLSIDFTVSQAPPAQFVGWVVERQVIGLCAEDAWVTEVMPWPETGSTHLDLTITPDLAYYDAIYRIWAVDAYGNETFIYWPQRHNFAHAECLPGPAVVGYFVDYGGNVYFESCTENCWPGLSPFDGTYPAGSEALVGSGQLMMLHGELFMGMEGVYIHSTAMVESFLPCEPVGTVETSWGALKAIYR